MVYETIDYWHLIVQNTPLAALRLEPDLARYWVELYGYQTIQARLPHAIENWLKKCEKEQRDPTSDLNYLRNYVQVCLRPGITKVAP